MNLIYPIRANIPNHPATYTRDRMKTMWDALADEGKIPWLFYDGGVRDALDYIDFMTSPDVFAYAVYDQTGETPLCAYWVDGFMGRAAKMHFAFLDAGLPHMQRIGVETCNFLLRQGGLSCLIGLTPKPFRHAWQYALSVGFVRKTIIPGGCYLNQWGRFVDAVATLCTPETLLPL